MIHIIYIFLKVYEVVVHYLNNSILTFISKLLSLNFRLIYKYEHGRFCAICDVNYFFLIEHFPVDKAIIFVLWITTFLLVGKKWEINVVSVSITESDILILTEWIWFIMVLMFRC